MKGKDKTLLTVIMPLKYYRADFLEQSIQSMLGQTCPNWRLLIVVEEADFKFFKNLLNDKLRDPRIKMLTMTGRPFTGSINSGMRHARTEFVALLFADDMWAENAVAVLNAHIQANPQIDFFHSSRGRIDEHGKPTGSIRLSKETFTLDDFKKGSPVKHLLCWRRQMGLSVGGVDETLIKAPDDYDFPWTMAENGATFMAIKECLCLMRNHCYYYRRTTHIPLSVIKRGIRKILKKHGVGFFSRRLIVAKRRRGSLGKQAIYRNSIDMWIKQKIGYDARRDWRP